MKSKAFRAALPYTIPICIGFLFLGISYGFLCTVKVFVSLSGTYESVHFCRFHGIRHSQPAADSLQPFIRFSAGLNGKCPSSFYGISMLDKYKTPALKSPILFMACVTNLFHKLYCHTTCRCR